MNQKIDNRVDIKCRAWFKQALHFILLVLNPMTFFQFNSTNEIIGIDRVYISAYPPALYRSIRITDYDILNEFNDNIRVETRKFL